MSPTVNDQPELAWLLNAPSSAEATPAVAAILERLVGGSALGEAEGCELMHAPLTDLPAICGAASALRDEGKGRRVSFSPKVFIPLTHLCRDICGYCTFRQEPAKAARLYMTPEEVLIVARAGERRGCTEALFTLGERPEQRYAEAKDWLAHRGYRTTLDYLRDVSALVLEETHLLPHLNPGTMSSREMASLREVSASMGIMLENVSPRLYAPGGPHELAPSKRPAVRLKTLENAGKLKVPFTTGILIGIGETLEERVASLFAIKRLHEQHGHIQEVIVQNFRAKPETAMWGRGEPGTVDMVRTLAVSRLVLGKDANIQAPPNLTPRDFPVYLHAGLNDWGGVSPLTPDFVNPEAPWPHLTDLARRTQAEGFELAPRLPVYPSYIAEQGWLANAVAPRVWAVAGADGYTAGGIERYVRST